MPMNQEELNKFVIDQTIEFEITEGLTANNVEAVNLKKSISDISDKVEKIKRKLDKADSDDITKLDEATYHLHTLELRCVYERGLKDCVSILKKLGIL